MSMMKSADALQTFYVLIFCTIRSWLELLACMALFMNGVTRPLAGTLWEEDGQVHMHGALYGGDSC